MIDVNTHPEEMPAMPSVLDQIGNTPLVELLHLPGPELRAAGVRVFAKLEGNNPAGSVKDRPALAMIEAAEARGDIRPGDTLIEATSGNTGIALAMVAAVKGYRMVLIMPENQTMERRQAMAAYGAELVLVSREQGMEGARDLALAMQADGKGRVLDQFANDDNWLAHYRGTGPEIWQQTGGAVTHFVSAMGTTGTITGVSRHLKEMNAGVQIIGAQPEEGSSIAGIRAWPAGYEPAIRAKARIDRVAEVSQQAAEDTMRRLAREEGIFCGVSSGGAAAIALRVAAEAVRERRLEAGTAARVSVENALQDQAAGEPGVWGGMTRSVGEGAVNVVFIVCDRGDRYLSTGVLGGSDHMAWPGIQTA